MVVGVESVRDIGISLTSVVTGSTAGHQRRKRNYEIINGYNNYLIQGILRMYGRFYCDELLLITIHTHVDTLHHSYKEYKN